MLRKLEPPSSNEAHLWFAVADDFGRESLEEVYDWLSPEERHRHSRFHLAEGRRRYLVGRLLTRGVLSSYLQQDPKTLRFTHNEHGRPELWRQPKSRSLSFNLSNAFGMVVCCVTSGHPVGVDVEDLERSVDDAALEVARSGIDGIDVQRVGVPAVASEVEDVGLGHVAL